MWKKVLCFLLCVAKPFDGHAKKIRKIEADENRIVAITTALGYSTIIEFSSKPVSVVLGDQDAFKVEYISNSITVKPLISNAKSNLFVFTESDRFNCMLRAGSSSEVDYIVRVSPPRPAIRHEDGAASQSPNFKIIPIQKKASHGGYILKVVSLRRQVERSASGGVTIVDFELMSAKKDYAFSSRSVGVKQGSRFLFIENLYLDSAFLQPRQPPLRGKIVLLNKNFSQSKPITIVFAVPHATSPKKVYRIEVSLGTVRGDKNAKRTIE